MRRTLAQTSDHAEVFVMGQMLQRQAARLMAAHASIGCQRGLSGLTVCVQGVL